MKDLKGKRVLVVGLARSGRAVALCLHRRGALVMLSDKKPPGHFRDLLPGLLAAKIGLELGSQREETFVRQDLVVVSPGVPWDLPQLEAARRRGIPVVPEIEVAGWFLSGSLLGVTGSNGKTTTTTLLGEMLKASGFAPFVGGNIGVPLSSAVDVEPPPTMIVTELSSFQLEGIHDFHPHVAVMLNLTPNHQDRHPDFATYARAKAQIFRNQTGKDYAILNADDPEVMKLATDIASQKVLFSCRQNLPEGVMVAANGQVLYRVGYLERPLFKASDLRLRGEFNLEDALAATAAACVVGADFDALRQAVRAFRGVEHRLEFVATIRGVEFHNNSKATSVDATAKTLGAFERGVHLIMGGKDKGAPYAPLRPLLKDRVRAIYLIGAAAARISEELSGAAELVSAGDLETAVREAFDRAVPGEVVLLAPACSSFDQFEDFEERGRVFKELAHRLEKESPASKPGARKTSGVPPKQATPARVAAPVESRPPARLEPAAKPESARVLSAPAKVEPKITPEPLRKTEPQARPEPKPKVEVGQREADAKRGVKPEPSAEFKPPVILPEEIVKAREKGINDQTPTEVAAPAPFAGPSPVAPRPPLPSPRAESDRKPNLDHLPSLRGEGGPQGPGEGSLPSDLSRSEGIIAEAPAKVETAEVSIGRVTARPVKYVDFISVYEVAAEERPTSLREYTYVPEDEEPAASSEEVSYFPEDVDDEPIPFEVRVATGKPGVNTHAAETIQQGPAPAMKPPKHRVKRNGAAEKGDAKPADSEPQGRLPGI